MFGRLAEGQDEIKVGARVHLVKCDGDLAHPAQAAVFEKEPAA